MISAVIAHYDPLGLRSANFARLLQSIRQFTERSVVVSTGITELDACSVTKLGFALIRRENVGYDFMLRYRIRRRSRCGYARANLVLQ